MAMTEALFISFSLQLLKHYNSDPSFAMKVLS